MGIASPAVLRQNARRARCKEKLMPGRLWSLGVFLVALGIAAYVVGWDALLWVPRVVLDSLIWVPSAILDAVSTSPATFGVIALGVVLMVFARMKGRRRD
ncbi:hypothetical protein ACFQU7_01020 [Pseudoroseomonas wenyumeiae]